MSPSQTAATGPPLVDVYPSPPASPESAKVKSTRVVRRKLLSEPDDYLATDSTQLRERLVTPDEDARPPTPAESTACEGAEAESAKEALELAAWKDALSLSSMLCGATRKKGGACERTISNKGRKGIDAIIKLLWIPGSSSLQLESLLDDLAKTVHCHLHDPPPFREARVRQWMTALPGGPRILSVQKRLRDILGGRPAKCITIRKADWRPCRGTIGNNDWFCASKTRERMIQVALEPTNKEDTLNSLETVLLHHLQCHTHKRYPQKQQKEWVDRVERFREACQAELDKRNKDPAMTEEAPTTEADNKSHGTRLASPSSTPSGKTVAADPKTYWGTAYDTSEWKIIGQGDMLEEGKSAMGEIHDIAKQPLKTKKHESEMHDGSVYIYQVPGNDKLVKIGFTTGIVTKRVDDWKRDCHRECVVQYPALTATTAAACVPHAHRVERLVHAELAGHRVRVYCERCEKQHNEWFEVSAERAEAIVEKWSLWMRRRPYHEMKIKSTVTWDLKEAEMKRLADVPGFLKELEEAVAAAEKTK